MGIPTCVGKTLGELSQTCWELVHPHVRGADAHESSGAALQYTTRRRGFPQLWGYGAQPPSSTPSTRLPFPKLIHAQAAVISGERCRRGIAEPMGRWASRRRARGAGGGITRTARGSTRRETPPRELHSRPV